MIIIIRIVQVVRRPPSVVVCPLSVRPKLLASHNQRVANISLTTSTTSCQHIANLYTHHHKDITGRSRYKLVCRIYEKSLKEV